MPETPCSGILTASFYLSTHNVSRCGWVHVLPVSHSIGCVLITSSWITKETMLRTRVMQPEQSKPEYSLYLAFIQLYFLNIKHYFFCRQLADCKHISASYARTTIDHCYLLPRTDTLPRPILIHCQEAANHIPSIPAIQARYNRL